MRKLSKDYYFELAAFLMDYHSGQWSRGYRLLCRMRPLGFNGSLLDELRESEAYQWLVANYAERV